MTPEELDRREFLRRIGATAGGLAGIAAGATVLGGCDGQPASSHPPSSTRAPGTKTKGHGGTDAVTTDSLGLPIAQWVVEENARPGTAEWLLHGTPPLGVEGFADHASAVAGDEVTVYVTSTARVVGPKIFRLGWYQGYGARLVADLGDYPGVEQPSAAFLSDTRTVECHWQPTFRFTVGDDWPSGYYLIRLGTSSGYAQWVPLVVRDDSSRSAVVIQSSMTTWQAYSLWGDYSLYLGPTSGGGDSVDNRAYMVSFDRPYAPGWEDGSADLFGNEYPMIALCERLGVDVTYWTDVDLHERPQLLTNHRLLVSLGHDEYWSSTMRFACQEALAKGVNFAFFGANACYRHIRFEPSPLGQNRRVVCYKDASLDPLLGHDDAEVTANWDSGPLPRPESQLIGIEYVAYQPIGTPFE
ncbi:MAG TPA: N,N-dimethylformamidase beta subunit family domain-containing protein, partial [Acidimicrobiales bacterium]|nr:N,N-dimethylformamidase beta subunit family domain-containing protein [Acidimicrobiales bacterium]